MSHTILEIDLTTGISRQRELTPEEIAELEATKLETAPE